MSSPRTRAKKARAIVDEALDKAEVTGLAPGKVFLTAPSYRRRSMIERASAYLADRARRERIQYAMIGMSLTLGALRMAAEVRVVLDGIPPDAEKEETDAPRKEA